MQLCTYFVQLCLTFLALGTGHVIPAQGNGCIFPVFDEICARNTKLQIGTILTKSKSRVISAFAINKTDSKPSTISIIFHAHLFCYFAKMLKDQQPTSQKEKESVTFTKRGRGGTQQMFILGRFGPEVQPLSFLRTIFDGKGTSFLYLLLTDGTPFPYLL